MVLLSPDTPAVYLGSSAATKVYLGSALAWEPGSGEPPTGEFPTDSGVLYRWKASDITGTDGATVSSWPAASGGVALTGTSTTRPTLQTNELNGKSVVRFDGTDDYLDTGASAFSSTAQPLTWYVVLNQSSTAMTGLRQVLFFDGDGGGNSLESMLDGGVRHTWAGSAYPGFGTQTSNVWTVWTLTFSGGTATSYLNGAADGSAGSTGTAATGTRLYLGRNRDNNRPFGGDIAEIIVCAGSHSLSMRNAMHGYLQLEYGIPA